MRRRVSDVNRFPEFSILREYEKLKALFELSQFAGRMLPVGSHTRPSYSICDCLSAFFLEWKLRGTFTSLEEMLCELEIGSDDFSINATEDRLLDYCQFLFNAVDFVVCKLRKKEYKIYLADVEISKAIIDNIKEICLQLGAEMIHDQREYYIVYKDDIADLISEEYPGLKRSILEYKKIDHRGDLVRKGEILCTLAKELEPYEKKLNGTEFAALCKDTTLLLNKSGARHMHEDKDEMGRFFCGLNQVELEKWYDKAFELFIACMAVLPYVEVKENINQIKRGNF